MASWLSEFGAGIALRTVVLKRPFGQRSTENAFVCLVADRYRFGCGDLYGSSQPPDSELAGVSFFWLRSCGLDLAARLAWSGTEFFGSGPGAADLRVSFLDGRNGRGRCEALRGDWSMDWALPVVSGAGDDWPGRRSNGAGSGGVGWIFEGIVSAHRRSGVQREGSRRSSFE